MTTPLLVLCTVPETKAAQQLASMLVRERLAACVNIVPSIQSVYEWQGKVEQSSECLLVIKSTETAYPSLQTRLHEAHPYDTPEIIALDISAGLPAYLNWLSDAIKPSSGA